MSASKFSIGSSDSPPSADLISKRKGLAPAGRSDQPGAAANDDFHEAELQIELLGRDDDRSAIAELRRLSAFTVERDLGIDLAAHEATRDDLGLVAVIRREDRVIATARAVPVGFGMTAAENIAPAAIGDSDILEGESWEIGRIVMAPEHRHPLLLQRCLALALGEFLKQRVVDHMHASTTLPMARLWQRFGMRTVTKLQGQSGTRYALVHGSLTSVVAALRHLKASEIYRPEICGAGALIRSIRDESAHLAWHPTAQSQEHTSLRAGVL